MAVENLDKAGIQQEQHVLFADGTGAVVVEDASHLFGAEFMRDGPDLVLRNAGAADIRIVDYFRTGAPGDLQTPDGATLRGPVVERLAGPEAPGQYAQAGAQETAVPIGQVESVAGSASVQRSDGTTEPLTQSARIFLDDVVQTVGDSTLSITFVDGTIFTLSADSRMVIDELIYTPDGTDNSAVFDLVQGGFIFIAGQVAGSGGMEVTTPAATMGIRGTTVLADVQTQGGVATVEVTLTRDPDGGIGRVELFDLSGSLITTITGIDTKWIVSTDDTQTREVDRTSTDEAGDNVLIAEAVAAYQSAGGRFARDGSYLELDGVSSNGGRAGQQEESGEGEDQIDLDGEDAEPIEEPEDDAAPDGPDDGSFDEGGLQRSPQNPDFDVFRTTLEDAEDGPVAGQLSNEVNLRGAFTLLTGAANGTVILAGDGSYSYTPAPNFNGVDRFTYSVAQDDGRSAVGTVTIDVTPVNDLPVIQDARLGGLEDTVLLGKATAVDVDGPSLSYSLGSPASNGSVVVTSTGAWSYTPAADFAGLDSFEIRVSDGAGGAVSQTVSVTVAPVNDAPVIDTDPSSLRPRVLEDAAPGVSGQLTATDPDQGDVLTWSGSAAGTYGDFTITAGGAWTYTLGPSANALAEGQQVTDRFPTTVTDTTGLTATADVIITVIGSNDAPTASNITFATVGSGQISGRLVATDPDGNDLLSFAAGSGGPQNGSVIVNPDGTFTYTPNPGFVGLDGFDYSATDPSGATTTARATLSVQSGAVAVPSGGQVSVSIYPDPLVGPAGQVVATTNQPTTQSLNLVIAMDRSVSVRPEGWAEQIDAVTAALQSLKEDFAGTNAQVDVKIIPFATGAVQTATFDLNDPNLISTVQGLAFTGGGTNWTQALTFAETFFDSQPAEEINYLYMISDGRPRETTWNDVLDRMTDSAEKGYSIKIEAFGIGPNIDETVLKILDPEPVLLSGPQDLLAALDASPLLSSRLVDLSVRLIADGTDRGEIADETHPAITVDGLDTQLALADIAGLADLLGEDNLFSVTAGFDLDGDASTAEIELFTSQQFTRQGAALSLDGTEESDLLFGSDFADVLAGNGGNDIILGFGGDDVISTGSGLNHVHAGAGDDRILLQSADAPGNGFRNVVNGGSGRDVLDISFGGDINADMLGLIDLSGVEALDFDNGAANSLVLTLEDIFGLSDEADTELETLLGALLPQSATIYGDSADTVTLVAGSEGTFVDTGTTVTDADGGTLDIYTYVDGGAVLATLAVDSDVAVTLAPATA